MKYKILSFIILTLFIFGILMNIYINANPRIFGIKDKVIRFHVVANSDSHRDQLLKLKIRDAVLEEIGPKLKSIADKDIAKGILEENIKNIKEIAEKEVKRFGKNFPIEVEIARQDFPIKTYGNLTFPEGEYQALNIKVGDANGKNYWCVMFPPLCFTDLAQETLEEEYLEDLSKVLTRAEIQTLKTYSKDRSPIKMKFKIAEVLEKLNIRFAGF